MDEQIRRAKALLTHVLSFEELPPWQPAKVVMRVAKQARIPKQAVKQARKELGVLSVKNADGAYYWAFPERAGLPVREEQA